MVINMWPWLHSLYSISFLFIVISVLWSIAKYFVAILSLVFAEKVQNVFLKLAHFIPMYFMTTFAASIGLEANGGEKSVLILTLGGLFLLLQTAMGISSSENQMRKENNYNGYDIVQFQYIVLLIGVFYYIFLIFKPELAFNEYTLFIANTSQWLSEIPVIGWFIAGASFVYLLYIAFIGSTALFVMILTAFVAFVSLFVKKPTNEIDTTD